MWSRTAEAGIIAGGVRIRHTAASGPECRLRAALLRWDTAGGGVPGVTVAGASWEGPEGTILWGWPGDAGEFQLRPGTDHPEVHSVLPPALSLALAIRRSGAELGARALVIGDGFLGRVARAVVWTAGFRITVLAGRGDQPSMAEARPDLVIETTGERRNIEWSAETCRDRGRVFSMGGALTRVPLDYYPHVHRRALTVVHVPHRPVLCPGEEAAAERSFGGLAEALRGVAPSRDEELNAQVLPEGTPGRLARESSGWGLFVIEER